MTPRPVEKVLLETLGDLLRETSGGAAARELCPGATPLIEGWWNRLLFGKGQEAGTRCKPQAEKWRRVSISKWVRCLVVWVPVGALAVTLFLGWLIFSSRTEQTYSTNVGEIRKVVLPDGSIVDLNTETRLEWAGREGTRRAVLLAGEAFFEVHHDPARPFLLRVGESEIQDLGTEFDVYMMSSGIVRVTVLSGAVLVKGLRSPEWERQVRANESMKYQETGPIGGVHRASGPSAISWRTGELWTPGEPLSQFIADLNRYSRERIVISDPRVAVQEIGGKFRIDHVRETLERLSRVAPVSVEEENGVYVLGYRSQSPSR